MELKFESSELIELLLEKKLDIKNSNAFWVEHRKWWDKIGFNEFNYILIVGIFVTYIIVTISKSVGSFF